MAIAYRASGAQGNKTVTTGTTIDIPYPASVASGELLVMNISTNAGATSTPANWTAVYTAVNSNVKGGLFIKVAVGNETGNLTVTVTGVLAAGRMHAFTGVDTVTPQDVTATTVDSGAGTGDPVIPQLTPSRLGVMLFYCCGGNSSTTTWTSANATAEVADFAANKSGAGYYEGPLASVSATGTRTLAQSVARANWAAMMAMRPAEVPMFNPMPPLLAQ